MRVLDLLDERAPTLGRSRLLCIDGPAGSGKTTLAGRVVEAWPGTSTLVHMDDLYEGWSGLEAAIPRVARLLEPLRRGRPSAYRRYDWVAGAWAEEHPVEPADLVVVEGVGSGSRPLADAMTVLVWVEAGSGVRLDRGVARDGQAMRDHWIAWREAEEALFAREGTRERADVTVRT